jgi:hypothetical protein
MIGKPKYDKDWERKKQWYRQNGYFEQLLITPIEGRSLSESLKEIFCHRFGYSEDQFKDVYYRGENGHA